jgi:4-diphosphocytidyl-2-C-methyl-D-erythritol kinase
LSGSFFTSYRCHLPSAFCMFASTGENQTMLAFANAKINIGLNITAKRADGYHDIETVFYPVKINDVVEITDSDVLQCVVQGIQFSGAMDQNLCYRAFKLLQQRHGFRNQQITLLKNISVGAGLGGGSSDAAHVIKLINDKFQLGLSFTEMEVHARTLGADCAFFIQNKPVFAKGRGDEFENLDLDLSAYHITLITPPVHVSTAEAYAQVHPKAVSRSLPDLLQLPVADWKGLVHNDFEDSVNTKYPAIKKLKDDLYQAGALYAALSGSGSSVFGIFKEDIRLPELENCNKVYYNV